MYSIDLYKVFKQVEISFESVNFEKQQKTKLAEIMEIETEIWTIDDVFSKKILSVRLNQTDSSLCPFGAKENGIDSPKDSWSFHLQHHRMCWEGADNQRQGAKLKFRRWKSQLGEPCMAYTLDWESVVTSSIVYKLYSEALFSCGFLPF